MSNIKNYARNLEDVKELNLSFIIKLMLKMKICSRVDLAKASGLRQSTITNIVNDLIARGLICETGSIAGKRGRRSIGITINADAYKAIAIRIKRTGYMVGRFNINGDEDEIVVRELDRCTASELMDSLYTDVEHLIHTSSSPVLGIGVSLPGPLMTIHEHIIFMTNSTADWKNISIRKSLSSRFHLPIYVEHDANAGVLAEWWFGTNSMERGYHVYIAAGQGIGAGLAIDGKIVHGAIGIAGEIGHICIDYNGPLCQCGNHGCLEKYCSVIALRDMARNGISEGRQTCLSPQCTAADIADAFHAGDIFAAEIYEHASHFLSIGLINVINMFNPSTIIIGDELPLLFPELPKNIGSKIAAALPQEVIDNVEIRASSFDCDPALIGAAAKVIEKAFSRPSEVLNHTSL